MPRMLPFRPTQAAIPGADPARRRAARAGRRAAALAALCSACSGEVATGPAGTWARTITVRDSGGLTQIARLNRVDLAAGDSLIVRVVGRNDGSDSATVWQRICDPVATVDPADLEGPQIRCLVADFQIRIAPRDSIVARTAYLVRPRQQAGTSTLQIHLPQPDAPDLETAVTLRPAPDA